MENKSIEISTNDILSPEDATWAFETHSDGPSGSLPLTSDILIKEPSGILSSCWEITS